MKYIFVLTGLFFTGFTGHGQSLSKQTVDSMANALRHSTSDSQKADLQAAISLQLAEAYPDSALRMARQGAAIALAAGAKTPYAKCLESVGWSYLRLEKNDSAEYYMTQSISIFHSLHKDRDEAHVMVNLTTLYDYEENNEKLMEYLLKALALMEGLNDRLGKAVAEQKIADCYMKQGLNEKAMPYLQEALQDFRELHQYAFLGAALNYQGQIYLAFKNYDSAFISYREASQAYRQADFTAGEAAAAEEIANVFLEKSNRKLQHPYTDSALYYFQQSYHIFSKAGRIVWQAYEQMYIGEVLILLKKYDEAARDLKEALQAFVTDKSPKFAYEATLYLSKLYKETGDYKKAIDYLEQSGVYKDSMDATNRKETMANMFARYETDKKDKTIQLLNAQKALADKELSRNKVIGRFSFSLVALIVALAVVLWKQVRIRHQLKEVQMRNQLAGDLHDDIGSSLSSILLLSNMATRNQGGNDRKGALEKIGFTAREVMDKISDIVWTMNPQNDGGTSIRERIEKLGLQVRDISSLQLTIAVSHRLEELKLPMDFRKNIFLICKEALHNIVKHAEASCISLSIDLVHKDINLIIRDDGKGFDTTDHARGNGLGTMAQRAKACGGEFTIQSGRGEGTVILVVLPVPHSRYIFS
ncbi:MAG TPA: tetratricopeptide repeat protein [Puia sp.]|nr:tetratricopeptide repeat protein [Puia sp.]